MDATQTMTPPPTAQRAQALTPEQVWVATVNQLQLQMTKVAFDAHLKNVWLIEVDKNNRYIIGAANKYAQDWLENRLKGTVERTLSNIAGQETQVEFQVAGRRRISKEKILIRKMALNRLLLRQIKIKILSS